jgi:uncharacterized protein (TIRG00374 family)
MSCWRRVSAHPRAKPVARWLIGIGVLVLLLVGFDGAAVWSRLSTSNLALASIGIVGLTAAHLLAAATWRAICGLTAGVRLPWRATLRWYYAGQALGGVTPGNLGGDVYRIQALRSGGHAFSASVAPVVIQRATSYLALACLGGVALIALASSSHVAMSIIVPAAIVCVLGAVVAAALLVPPGRLAGVQRRLVRLIDGRSAAEASASRATPGLASASIVGFVLGLAFHLGCVLLTYLLVLAVDPLPFSPATVGAVAVARLSLAVPISPSGLGFQEGALSVLFVGIGLPPEVALAALLLARVSLVFTTIIGVAALALGRPEVGRPPGARNARPARGG